jgi:hypothetical protein
MSAIPFDLTWQRLAIAAMLFAVSLLATTTLAGFLLVRIRPDYFVAETRGVSRRLQKSTSRLLLLIGKNLLGGLLIVVGIILSLPGVPGQGLLTILVGLFLVDVPAKRKLELLIVRRPTIFHAINRLRDRFGAAPIIVDGIEETKRPSS